MFSGTPCIKYVQFMFIESSKNVNKNKNSYAKISVRFLSLLKKEMFNDQKHQFSNPCIIAMSYFGNFQCLRHQTAKI